MRGAGPRAVITDFGMLTPEPGSDELQLTAVFPEVHGRARLAPPLAGRCRSAAEVEVIAAPTPTELETLRALHARTREAHNRPVRVPA